MSAVAIVALILGVGVVGYVGYDIYKEATKQTGLAALADTAKSDLKSADSGATKYVDEGLNDFVSLF